MHETSENVKPSGELKSSFGGIKAGRITVRHSGENSRRKSGGSHRLKTGKSRGEWKGELEGE